MKWAVEPIRTYELAPYSHPKPCYVCESENRIDLESCLRCGAPLSLSYLEVENQKTAPRFVTVLGTPGAGKTVYLGILTDILTRQYGGMQTLARGAFSVAMQHHVMTALAKRRFPERTSAVPSSWNWMHCDIARKKKRRPIQLVLPDISGTALQTEIENGSGNSTIRKILGKSQGAIVLVDCHRLEMGDQEQDYQAMRIAAFLAELEEGGRGSASGRFRKAAGRRPWGQRPVAIVFSKADYSQTCWDDPVAFARRWTPGLFRLCQERLTRHSFFAASTTGAAASGSLLGERFEVPLRIEPRGVVEPFIWLLDAL